MEQLEGTRHTVRLGDYLHIAFCDGGYTTNLPLEEVIGGKAWIVDAYEGEPLARKEHDGEQTRWQRCRRHLARDLPL